MLLYKYPLLLEKLSRIKSFHRHSFCSSALSLILISLPDLRIAFFLFFLDHPFRAQHATHNLQSFFFSFSVYFIKKLENWLSNREQGRHERGDHKRWRNIESCPSKTPHNHPSPVPPPSSLGYAGVVLMVCQQKQELASLLYLLSLSRTQQ